jgi:hypothetical protein
MPFIGSWMCHSARMPHVIGKTTVPATSPFYVAAHSTSSGVTHPRALSLSIKIKRAGWDTTFLRSILSDLATT